MADLVDSRARRWKRDLRAHDRRREQPRTLRNAPAPDFQGLSPLEISTMVQRRIVAMREEDASAVAAIVEQAQECLVGKEPDQDTARGLVSLAESRITIANTLSHTNCVHLVTLRLVMVDRALTTYQAAAATYTALVENQAAAKCEVAAAALLFARGAFEKTVEVCRSLVPRLRDLGMGELSRRVELLQQEASVARSNLEERTR